MGCGSKVMAVARAPCDRAASTTRRSNDLVRQVDSIEIADGDHAGRFRFAKLPKCADDAHRSKSEVRGPQPEA